MDMNHIHNHHDLSPTFKLPTSSTTTWVDDQNFSMAMEDHHHHQHQHLANEQHHHQQQQHHLHPLTSLFDQQVWPNYLHNNINNHTSSSSTLLSMKSTLQTTKLELEQEQEHEDEDEDLEDDEEELGAMKEMMYRYAVMQPVDIDPATIRKPKRRNVRISNDPQSVAARLRRERISEKIRILQRLVPGGTKMDTASMLDEAIRYVKFLKKQIRLLQRPNHNPPSVPLPSGWPVSVMGQSSNDPGVAKVVLTRDHFDHHQGIIFHHEGN